VLGIIKEASWQENLNETLPEDILQNFHVYFPEQDVFLKGDFHIELEDYIIETKFFYGGLTISAKDIQRMHKVIANTPNVLTVENRTAFLRMNSADYSLIYLGGYAKRSQIHFIKRLYQDNPHIDYYHFGDIDVGGLQIHQHLCSATGISFKTFHMGVGELNDKRFQNCLRPLSANDLERIEMLRNVPLYQDVIGEMLKKKAKLEQEIVCLMLEEDADGSSEQF
jgi:DNA topoisomerase VI subunit A